MTKRRQITSAFRFEPATGHKMSHQTGITGNFCCIIQPYFKYSVFYTIKKTQNYLSAYNLGKISLANIGGWVGGVGFTNVGDQSDIFTFMTMARPILKNL